MLERAAAPGDAGQRGRWEAGRTGERRGARSAKHALTHPPPTLPFPAGPVLTDDCKAELAAFKADAATNVNKNLPLAVACASDAARLCADADPGDDGAVLACLLELRPELGPECQAHVFAVARDASLDWRVDPDVRAACEADAAALCADADPGAGDVLACLRDAAASLESTVSLDCAEQLFRQAVENADDVRLSARLARACARDRVAFCEGVTPGRARIAACLEANRDEPSFSAECRSEFEAMMEARALDFRLDASLRDACAADIVHTCGYEAEEKDAVPDDDPVVAACLQDHKDELKSDACAAAVRAVAARGAADVRFDVGSPGADPLADACAADREKHCAHVPPGSARVVRCLQGARDVLAAECAASLFDAEVRAAESIDFKLPLARACGAEAARHCAGTPHAGGAMQRCLAEHAAAGGAGAACRAELEADARRSARDYRLNYRLKTACEADVASLCAGACAAATDGSCGGRVLACLADKQDAITAKACKDEVFYFVKMQVADYRNDILLAEACRSDVDARCAAVPAGDVLACLRAAREQLTPACRREELRLSVLQSRDARLFPAIAASCGREMSTHCKDVPAGHGRVVTCLQRHAGDAGFGAACADAVAARAAELGASYRNDYALATACEADAKRECAVEAASAHGDAAVLGCLVRRAAARGALAPACAPEVARAARLALWGYAPGAPLTAACDADVAASCAATATAAPADDTAAPTAPHAALPVWSIGAVGRCLSTRLALNKPLAPGCRAVVVAAAPADAHALLAGTAAADALLARVAAWQESAGLAGRFVDPRVRGVAGVTLSGWGALAGVAALSSLLVGAGTLAVRAAVRGKATGYVVVTKQGDV